MIAKNELNSKFKNESIKSYFAAESDNGSENVSKKEPTTISSSDNEEGEIENTKSRLKTDVAKDQTCPICGKDLSKKNNTKLNQHIDECLNREIIDKYKGEAKRIKSQPRIDKVYPSRKNVIEYI